MEDEIVKELDDMDESHLLEPDEPSEPEATPEPAESAPEAPGAPEATEAPVEPTPDAPEPSNEEALRAQLEQMREAMAAMAAQKPLVEISGEPEGQAPDPQELARAQQEAIFQSQLQAQQALLAQIQQKPEEEPEGPKPLVTDEMFDELMTDPEVFNQFITNALETVRENAVQEAYGLAMQKLPSEILPTIYEANQSTMAVSSWADNTPVVAQNREVAATVLNQIDATNPKLPLQQKLQMTEQWLNKTFGATNPAPQATPTQPVQRPAFPQAPKGPRPAVVNIDALQQEIDELTL